MKSITWKLLYVLRRLRIFDTEVGLTPSVLYRSSVQPATAMHQSAFKPLSLQFAFRDSTTNRYSRIHLHFPRHPRRHLFYSSSLLGFLPASRKALRDTLIYIYSLELFIEIQLRAICANLSNILVMLWIVTQLCFLIGTRRIVFFKSVVVDLMRTMRNKLIFEV